MPLQIDFFIYSAVAFLDIPIMIVATIFCFIIALDASYQASEMKEGKPTYKYWFFSK